jgi:hypothetical protein
LEEALEEEPTEGGREVTEMTTKRSIAETIRYSRRPEGEMADLSAQAGRLYRSVAVAEKWIEATMQGDVATEMTSRAEMIHDQIEEELSRVVWKMELLANRRLYRTINDERPEASRIIERRRGEWECAPQ